MNEHNHHKIIERFSRKNGLSKKEEDILVKASDFTDSINAEWKYFFYHFYYSIEISDNSDLNQGTIRLYRVDENTNVSAQDMNRCGKIYMSLIGTNQIALQLNSDNKFNTSLPYSSLTNEKEFFSTINERKKSPKSKLFDIGNQSDNVAFLHAMRSEGEGKEAAKTQFKEHLKRCFSEYLFLGNEKAALFMLGIAMHGIMDSFTPSHTLFQNYDEQDMAKHAQGDVIPFPEDVLNFVPGQFDREGVGAKLLNRFKKGFNANDKLNETELTMLRIFLRIGDIQGDESGGLFEGLNYPSRTEVNLRLNKHKYGPKAFIYLNYTLKTLCEVYKELSGFRHPQETCEDDEYTRYKKSKSDAESIVIKACEIWENEYGKFVKEFDKQLVTCFLKIADCGRCKRCMNLYKDKKTGHINDSLLANTLFST